MLAPIATPNKLGIWKRNMSFVFNNSYDATTNTNTLNYQGGNGYERLYLPVICSANQTVEFSVKFCSPTGYSCSYGDSQEYIAITSNEPSNSDALSSQSVLASTPLDGTASNTPVLYTVSYTPTTDTILYLVIDYGYMIDGVLVTLVYQDITLTGATVDIGNMWYVQNERLTNQYLPDPMDSLMTSPNLQFWWYVDNNKLVTDLLPPACPHVMEAPYPDNWWYVVDDDFGERLTHNQLPLPLGYAKYRFIYNGRDITRVIYDGTDIASVIYTSE